MKIDVCADIKITMSAYIIIFKNGTFSAITSVSSSESSLEVSGSSLKVSGGRLVVSGSSLELDVSGGRLVVSGGSTGDSPGASDRSASEHLKI